MRKSLLILAIVATITQTRIIPYYPTSTNFPFPSQSQQSSSRSSSAYQNPVSNGGSYSPPDVSSDTSQGSYSQLGASANSADAAARKKYDDFKRQHGKFYGPEEDNYRYLIFTANSRDIDAHNADPRNTYKKGINQFTDMTQAQFASKILMKHLPVPPKTTSTSTSTTTPTLTAITPIDWTQTGKVGPIKDQGQCGSCWAFSVVGVIESNVAIKKSTTPGVYSQQQLVDCCGARGFGCSGCNGAWPPNAFNYVASFGLTNSASYPYVARVQTCQDNYVTKTKYLVSNPSSISAAGSLTLSKLYQGPLSVALDASNWSSYASGIFSCTGAINYNHAVILVGVDSLGNWKVRNSWGTYWGEYGYIRLNSVNNCGLQTYALYPNLL